MAIPNLAITKMMGQVNKVAAAYQGHSQTVIAPYIPVAVPRSGIQPIAIATNQEAKVFQPITWVIPLAVAITCSIKATATPKLITPLTSHVRRIPCMGQFPSVGLVFANGVRLRRLWLL